MRQQLLDFCQNMANNCYRAYVKRLHKYGHKSWQPKWTYGQVMLWLSLGNKIFYSVHKNEQERTNNDM